MNILNKLSKISKENDYQKYFHDHKKHASNLGWNEVHYRYIQKRANKTKSVIRNSFKKVFTTVF